MAVPRSGISPRLEFQVGLARVRGEIKVGLLASACVATVPALGLLRESVQVAA